MIRAVLSLAVAACALPALAQTSATPAAATQTMPGASATTVPPVGVADDDRVVCRSERRTTTRFPVRTCRTQKEWKQHADANRLSQERATERYRPAIRRPDTGLTPGQ